MSAQPTILEAIESAELFAPLLDGDSWDAWKAVLAAMFALPLNRKQRRHFAKLAGGRKPPKGPVQEFWAVVGRRGGKTFIAALIVCFLAAFWTPSRPLQPGEIPTVLLLACDRKQAAVAMGYCRGIFETVPLLAEMMDGEGTKDTLDLLNGVSIQIATNDYRAVRGRTLIAAVLDESAFFKDEQSATPDVEVVRALLPALATTGGPLLGISSPHMKSGVLWTRYKDSFGKDDDRVLVVQGATRDFNPSIDAKLVERALEDDPDAAGAEWLGLFRSDIEALFRSDAVDACTVPGRFELSPVPGTRYAAFLDAAGGSGKDSMTLAIGHETDGVVVLDCLREATPPFSPPDIAAQFAATLKAYGVSEARADRYAGDWPVAEFRRHGITIKPAEKPKSDYYLALLPVVNGAKLDLLDHPKARTQLSKLERRVVRGTGREVIDHPAGEHDDLANVIAGVAAHCDPSKRHFVKTRSMDPWSGSEDRARREAMERMRLRPDGTRGYSCWVPAPKRERTRAW